MIQVSTMVDMTTPMDPHALVGWVIREGIQRSGTRYTQAARTWHISLPTLNRMMSGQPVSLMFYRVAERELGMPWNLLDHILDGDVAAVRAAPIATSQSPIPAANLRNWIIATFPPLPITPRARCA